MSMKQSLRAAVVPLFMLACLLLGGSAGAAWPNMALQLSAIAILACAVMSAPRMQAGMPERNLVRLCYAMVGLVLVQLSPLPPAVWSTLPGRETVVQGFALLGQPLPWLPLSLSPYETMTSALWLLPPLAIIAAMLRVGGVRRRAARRAPGNQRKRLRLALVSVRDHEQWHGHRVLRQQ
jgi:hypothetical protein